MSLALHIESYIPFPDDGRTKTRYLGTPNIASAADSDPQWTIYRFSHELTTDSQIRVIEIDVRHSVAWDDRASLDW